jgi:hypothetical protein
MKVVERKLAQPWSRADAPCKLQGHTVVRLGVSNDGKLQCEFATGPVSMVLEGDLGKLGIVDVHYDPPLLQKVLILLT